MDLGKFGPNIEFAPILMKFGTHSKSSILIMNIIHISVHNAGVIIDTEWL